MIHLFHDIITNGTEEIMPLRNSLLPGEKLVNTVNIEIILNI